MVRLILLVLLGLNDYIGVCNLHDLYNVGHGISRLGLRWRFLHSSSLEGSVCAVEGLAWSGWIVVVLALRANAVN